MFIRADKDLRTYCGYSVSSAPERITDFQRVSTLQFSLYLCSSDDGFLCTDTFWISHDLSSRTLPTDTGKQEDIIRLFFHLLDFTLSCCRRFLNRLSECVSYPLFQYRIAVLWCRHKVLSPIISYGTLSFYTHASTY